MSGFSPMKAHAPWGRFEVIHYPLPKIMVPAVVCGVRMYSTWWYIRAAVHMSDVT